ncbi:MAG: hypothetical protein WDW36_002885 [Sanguina aurantia]
MLSVKPLRDIIKSAVSGLKGKHTVQSAATTTSPITVVAQTPFGTPLPLMVHRTLAPEQMNTGRVIIVGDVHGCNRELRQLLAHVKFEKGVDNLILAGDLVNKGADSLGVLQTAREFGAISVRGNHDDKSLAAYLGWKSSGKCKKKRSWVKGMGSADVEALSTLPFSVTLPAYNITVVHAGLIPGVALQQQQLQTLYTIRNLVEQGGGEDGKGKGLVAAAPIGSSSSSSAPEDVAGNRWSALEEASKGGDPWSTHWTGPGHVFFGHDAKRRLQQRRCATGLDTGCVYGGRLTAAVLPPLEVLLLSEAFRLAVAGQGDVTLEVLQAQLEFVAGAEVLEPEADGAEDE